MDNRYRKFLALADEGSFSAAARSLHVTQPAISLAVASLEHSLGVKLYVRQKTPLALTAEAEIVARTARAMAAEFDSMRAELGNTSQEYRRIGLIDSVAHLLYGASGEHGSLRSMDVMVDNSRRILRDLTEGRLDLGVITGQPMNLGSDIAVHKLPNETFVFVAAPHKVSRRATRHIDDWLATDKDSTSYGHFLELFRRVRLQVTPIFHSASMELLKNMAIAGEGTALLPRHIVQPALDDGTLAVVKTKPLYRPIWAVTRSGEKLPATHKLETRLNTLLAASK